MNMTLASRPSPRVLIVLSLACLAVLALLSYGRMRFRADQLDAALAEAKSCRQLVADIEALEKLPRFAALEEESPGTMTARIHEASAAAGLPAGAAGNIDSRSPIRLQNSSYEVRPTRVDLALLTLEQIVTFADHLTDEGQGLTVRDLRLTAPVAGARAGGEVWKAEITLTQLIFSPISR